jgi:hypothetical protein
MNSHEVQGIAAKNISLFIDYCMEAGMIDEILRKHYSVADTDQIKTEMMHISEQLAQSADYHKAIRDALKGGGA